jgi:hypothetical protein
MKVFRAALAVVAVFALTVALRSPGFAGTARHAGKQIRNTVWLAYFSSHDCPKCEGVKDLIEIVKIKYPVRVKAFDVENDKDYALFRKLQSIHCPDGFSVPLIMVGDTILMGEDEITTKLDKTIGGLVKAGGARLPYLGPARSTVEPKNSTKCNCNRDKSVRPPTASEEWKSIRSFLNNLF